MLMMGREPRRATDATRGMELQRAARLLAARGARMAAAAIMLSVAAGCGALMSKACEHCIFVHQEGYPIDQNRKRVSPENFRNTVWKQIEQGLSDYLANVGSGTPRLLVFVHGGLNRYESAIEHMDHVIKAQKRSPSLREHFLLFINWDSSFFTSVVDDLFVNRFGTRLSDWGIVYFGIPTAPLVTGARLAQSVFLAPVSVWKNLVTLYEAFPGDEGKWLYCAPVAEGDRESLVANEVNWGLFWPIRVLTVPVIQGFGTPAWDTMKRRAELVTAPKLAEAKGDPKDVSTPKGAGILLMDELKARILRAKDKPEDPWRRLRITLVGHSMGTMILNRILEEYSDMEFERIVYLAAAASMDEVRGAVLPYLRRHEEATFWGFSLYETLELAEFDGPDLLERGSLLVWIDNLFEHLNAPGNLTFGRARNPRQYFVIPKDLGPKGKSQRLFLVRFDRGQRDPQRHGDFSKPEILERVLKIVYEKECPIRP